MAKTSLKLGFAVLCSLSALCYTGVTFSQETKEQELKQASAQEQAAAVNVKSYGTNSASQKSYAPQVKVYGNKTPTMIGTREQVAQYKADLAEQQAKQQPSVQQPNAQVYYDENGNVVTITPGNNFYYGGGYYPCNPDYADPGCNRPYPPQRPYPPHRPYPPNYRPDPVDPGFNHPSTIPPHHGGHRPYPPHYPNHPYPPRPMPRDGRAQ